MQYSVSWCSCHSCEWSFLRLDDDQCPSFRTFLRTMERTHCYGPPLYCIYIPTRIFCRGVSWFVTALTTYPLLIGPSVANCFHINWFVSSIKWGMVFLYHVKYIFIAHGDVYWNLRISFLFLFSPLKQLLWWHGYFVLPFPIDAILPLSILKANVQIQLMNSMHEYIFSLNVLIIIL